MTVKKSKKSILAESVSLISHRLRTPISVIKGALETVLSDELGPLSHDQKDYLEDALKNTERLIHLINNLLEVSAIEEGLLKLSPQIIDLAEITEKVIQQFIPLTRASNSEIFFQTPKFLPKVKADPHRVKEIVTNLINNAIKYTSGKGKIEIILQKQSNDVLFSCQDNGIGISKQEASHIFTKYFRGDRVITAETEGSGLGLYIAKAFIEKSGGKIWFESEPDKGTTFYFTLPIINNEKNKSQKSK